MDIKLIVGVAAGCLTAIASTPQIIKTLKTKDVSNVSPIMFLILAAGNGLWCWYGIMLEDWPIILTNAFSLAMDIFMLILRIVYKRNT